MDKAASSCILALGFSEVVASRRSLNKERCTLSSRRPGSEPACRASLARTRFQRRFQTVPRQHADAREKVPRLACRAGEAQRARREREAESHVTRASRGAADALRASAEQHGRSDVVVPVLSDLDERNECGRGRGRGRGRKVNGLQLQVVQRRAAGRAQSQHRRQVRDEGRGELDALEEREQLPPQGCALTPLGAAAVAASACAASTRFLSARRSLW